MELPEDLAGLSGAWIGTYRLWLEPDVLARECPTTAVFATSPAAGTLSYRYSWSYDDEDHDGVALLVRTGAGGWEMSWTDSWHQREALLRCTGDGPQPSVTGTYAETDDGPWCWRTELRIDDGQVVVTAYNIDPSGREARATEAVYTRAS